MGFPKTLLASPVVRVSRWLGMIWPVAGFEWLTSTDYLLFFGVQTLEAGVIQDEETSLEQICRQV